MTNEETAPPVKLEVADGTLFLWRGCKFEVAPQQWSTGDRMTVRDQQGAEEEVVIIGAGPQRTVKRLVLQIEMLTRKAVYRLEDLDAANQKRLLAIYKMFDGLGVL